MEVREISDMNARLAIENSSLRDRCDKLEKLIATMQGEAREAEERRVATKAQLTLSHKHQRDLLAQLAEYEEVSMEDIGLEAGTEAQSHMVDPIPGGINPTAVASETASD